ncbi:hypothetical protein ACHAXN_011544 [Cyclotella atomus]
MLSHVLEMYSVDGGQSFQDFVQSIDFEALLKTDDHFVLVGRDPFYAARHFSSRANCSCIPQQLGCGHGFPNPDSGDWIYLFMKAYDDLFWQKQRNSGPPFEENDEIAEKLDRMGLSHLWNSEDKRKKIISHLLSFGTELTIAKQYKNALVVAAGIKCLEKKKSMCRSYDEARPQNSMESFHSWAVAESEETRFVMDFLADPERHVTKFFSSRIPCSCLNEQYQELKSGRERGVCCNCLVNLEKRQLMTCQQCGSYDYCGKACQRAHWPTHKGLCLTVAQMKAALL